MYRHGETMDKKEKEMNAFLLTPDTQEKLREIMEKLEAQGYPTNNKVLSLVLREMWKQGSIIGVDRDSKQFDELIDKVVPMNGKILHIKPEEKCHDLSCGPTTNSKTSFLGRLKAKLERLVKVYFLGNS